MTLSHELTATQESALTELRKAHNQANPSDTVTVKQFGERLVAAFIEARTDDYFQSAISELKPAYRAASDATKAQVRTLLGI